jgi:hypothetical protein
MHPELLCLAREMFFRPSCQPTNRPKPKPAPSPGWPRACWSLSGFGHGGVHGGHGRPPPPSPRRARPGHLWPRPLKPACVPVLRTLAAAFRPASPRPYLGAQHRRRSPHRFVVSDASWAKPTPPGASTCRAVPLQLLPVAGGPPEHPNPWSTEPAANIATVSLLFRPRSRPLVAGKPPMRSPSSPLSPAHLTRGSSHRNILTPPPARAPMASVRFLNQRRKKMISFVNNPCSSP